MTALHLSVHTYVQSTSFIWQGEIRVISSSLGLILFKSDRAKAKFFDIRIIANPSTGTLRFRSCRPLIHNVIAKILTPLINILMPCIKLLCSFKLIKSIEAMINRVKISAVI